MEAAIWGMRVGKAGFAISGFLAAAFAGAAVFFAMAPDLVERRLNRVISDAPASHRATGEPTPLFIADLHADTLLWKRPLLARNLRGHLDAPRLRQGGVRLQVFSVVTQLPTRGAAPEGRADPLTFLAAAQLQPTETWMSPFARARHQAQKLHRATDSAANFTLVRTRADAARLRAAHENNAPQLGGVLALEGLHALEGRAENLAVLFEDGYRVMGLQHFFDNALGGSLHGDESAGLTPFGRDIVADIEARGAIIDVAHSSPAVVADVLSMATRPIIVSHTGLRGACNSPRNISDDLMRRIAADGGLIGIGFWEAAVCDASPEGIARVIDYGVELLGAEHIALGSDFDGAVATYFDAAGVGVIAHALRARGMDEASIRLIMGENVLRFFEAHLPQE